MRDEVEALLCPACGARYPVRDEIPDLRAEADPRTERVRAFYSQAPFPGHPPQESLGSLRARAARSEFAMALDRAIPGDARVVEVRIQLSSKDSRKVAGLSNARAEVVIDVEGEGQ